jgi:hypothetical protein
MKLHRIPRWFAIAGLLALPVIAHAQEATLSGTVSDSTGGALPGVTVRAVHEASGNSFEAVTDERGSYRLPVRVGSYQITADLAGFAPVTRSVTLLAGQQAVVNLEMALSGVQESVTVTGEAPLLDVTTSTLGGNIDPRQQQELPVLGRNWVDLVSLAPGAKLNSVEGGRPGEEGLGRAVNPTRGGGDYQINVDGQQTTQLTTGSGGDSRREARFSRDAIAELEFKSSRFDATQGRSSGLQVNAITKSGANTPAGSFSGYFRHDRFNAADHVAGRVLPYENQQLSGTYGGPIRRDRLHFFANYEYEREPRTAVYETPFPKFNMDITDSRTEKLGGLRIDAQFSPQSRLMFRGNSWVAKNPGQGSRTSTPSTNGGIKGASGQLMATLTQVLNARMVNELIVSQATWLNDSYNDLLKNPNAPLGLGKGGPIIELRGLTIGGALIVPNRQGQDVYSVRDAFTYSTAGHTWKMGAEYLRTNFFDFRCNNCQGRLVANNGPIPANIEDLFPNQFDVTTWNLQPLSPLSVQWEQGFPVNPRLYELRHTFGFWAQDDWRVSSRLTLNLGVRYDLELNAFNNDLVTLPWWNGEETQPNDINNVGPRTGFSYTVNDRTVLRGGYGLYFGTVVAGIRKPYVTSTFYTRAVYDGRADFASNPWNGPEPTNASLAAKLCTPAQLPGCVRLDLPNTGAVYGPFMKMPYSHQASFGVQRQVGETMAVEADYVYSGGRDRPDDHNANVAYNPATGVNYDFRDISRRPVPYWGYVNLTVNGVRSNYHALQTALTKRFSDQWQANATYTLAVTRDARPRPVNLNEATGRLEPVPFPTAPDLGGEYGLAHGDQRHRATFNGIWSLPYNFQLSGLYFYGSGQRSYTTWGADLRRLGAIRPNENRLRPDGTVIPRNNFVGKPIHRVDMRIQRQIALGGRVRLDGLLEIFNVFNHANYGAYVVNESSASYGQPEQSDGAAFQPRILQLGFRLAF